MSYPDQRFEVIPELQPGELLDAQVLVSLGEQMDSRSDRLGKADTVVVDPFEGFVQRPKFVGDNECLEIVKAVQRHREHRGQEATRCRLVIDKINEPFNPNWHFDDFDQFTLSLISTEGLSGRIKTLPHERMMGAIIRESTKSRDLTHLEDVKITRAEPAQLVEIPDGVPHRSPLTPRLWINIRLRD